MAFWDRIRRWFSQGGSDAEQAPAERAVDSIEDEPLELDIDPEDSVPELILEDDEPSSMDSLAGLKGSHLDLPDLIDEDEVTELGVDPEAVRARMRRSDPMFPDDEITEITWLDSLGGEKEFRADDEPTDMGSDDLPARADEVPLFPSLDETRFVEETLPIPDASDLEPTTLVVADETHVGSMPEIPELVVADETYVGDESLAEAVSRVRAEAIVEEAVTLDPAAIEPLSDDDSEDTGGGEVTDFHLDLLAWDEDDNTDAERLAPVPAEPSSGPRFRNTLRIADTVVLQALRLEHYPDCDEVPDEMLHRMARCDEALLSAAFQLGETVEHAVRRAPEDELLESALLFTGLRTAPGVRDALAGQGAIHRRKLGWASISQAREIVQVAEVDGLADALAGFEAAWRERRRLLAVGPEVLAATVPDHPVEPVGLHRLDGFAWLG